MGSSEAVCFHIVKNLSKNVLDKTIPANIYLCKVSNRNARKKCEICSKLTIKTPE